MCSLNMTAGLSDYNWNSYPDSVEALDDSDNSQSWILELNRIKNITDKSVLLFNDKSFPLIHVIFNATIIYRILLDDLLPSWPSFIGRM